MYLLTLKFNKNKALRADFIAEHTKWVKKGFLNKVFIIAGQKTDENGGLILSINMDKHELQDLIKQDPLVKNGMAEYSISHFEPAFFQDEFINYLFR